MVATTVPIPGLRTTQLSAASPVMVWRVVARLTPRVRMISFSLGSRSPGLTVVVDEVGLDDGSSCTHKGTGDAQVDPFVPSAEVDDSPLACSAVYIYGPDPDGQDLTTMTGRSAFRIID